jgi:hypothetical protein
MNKVWALNKHWVYNQQKKISIYYIKNITRKKTHLWTDMLKQNDFYTLGIKMAVDRRIRMILWGLIIHTGNNGRSPQKAQCGSVSSTYFIWFKKYNTFEPSLFALMNISHTQTFFSYIQNMNTKNIQKIKQRYK